MTNEGKVKEDSKLFIRLMLSEAFRRAVEKSPGGSRFLINLAGEIETKLGELISEILETEKKQQDYYQQLINFAKAVDFKGDMLIRLKQSHNNKN